MLTGTIGASWEFPSKKRILFWEPHESARAVPNLGNLCRMKPRRRLSLPWWIEWALSPCLKGWARVWRPPISVDNPGFRHLPENTGSEPGTCTTRAKLQTHYFSAKVLSAAADLRNNIWFWEWGFYTAPETAVSDFVNIKRSKKWLEVVRGSIT